MDNILGKEEAYKDIKIENEDEQNNVITNMELKREENVDNENHQIKMETDRLSSQSHSDTEEVPQAELGDHLGVNHKNEIKEDFGKEDLFLNEIMIPNSSTSSIKERRESKEKSKKELEEEEREKMQVLVSNFTEAQLDRYEMYRRAAFPKAAIKRIMQTITGCSVSQNVVIAMSGIAKVFVGEVVEEALDVMERQQDVGPVQPKHLREAVRRLRIRGKIPNGRGHKAFYRL